MGAAAGEDFEFGDERKAQRLLSATRSGSFAHRRKWSTSSPPSIDRRGNFEAPFFVGFQFRMSGNIAEKTQERTYGPLYSSQLPGFSIQLPSLRCSL